MPSFLTNCLAYLFERRLSSRAVLYFASSRQTSLQVLLYIYAFCLTGRELGAGAPGTHLHRAAFENDVTSSIDNPLVLCLLSISQGCLVTWILD